MQLEASNVIHFLIPCTIVPFGVPDFIYPDGADLTERTVFQSERDDLLDGVTDLVPRGAERLGLLLPQKPARPTGQKQQLRSGKRAFAVTPGNLFDDHRLAATAIDAPHGIPQKHQKPQKGINSKRRSAS